MTTIKKIAGIAALSCTALMSASTSLAEERTIAFSPLSLDIPAFQGLSGALGGMSEGAGVGYMELDPKFDPATQAQQLSQLIETGRIQGAWSIVIAAPALRATVQAAVNNDVAMVVSGRPHEYGFDGQLPGIAFSEINYEQYGTNIGNELGLCINEKMNGEANIIFFGDSAGTEAAKITDNFAKDALVATASGANIVVENISQERLESQQKTSQMLLSNPDANAVYASNDENAMGAIAAFADAGKELPCIVSGGGSDEVLENVESGVIYAAAGFDFVADATQNFDTLLAMMEDPTQLGPILDIPIKITK